VDVRVEDREDIRSVAALGCAAMAVLGADVEVLRSGARICLAGSRGTNIGASALESMGEDETPSREEHGEEAKLEQPKLVRTYSGGGGSGRSALAQRALIKILTRRAAEATIIDLSSSSVRVYFPGEGGSSGTIQELPRKDVELVDEVVPDASSLGPSPVVLNVLCRLCDLSVGADLSGKQPFHVYWQAQLKSCAIQALQPLLQNPSVVEEARRLHLMDKLFQSALTPVPLPSFISSSRLTVSSFFVWRVLF
jgi:hypothetical protein